MVLPLPHTLSFSLSIYTPNIFVHLFYYEGNHGTHTSTPLNISFTFFGLLCHITSFLILPDGARDEPGKEGLDTGCFVFHALFSVHTFFPSPSLFNLAGNVILYIPVQLNQAL